jgi:hypothetical protein
VWSPGNATDLSIGVCVQTSCIRRELIHRLVRADDKRTGERHGRRTPRVSAGEFICLFYRDGQVSARHFSEPLPRSRRVDRDLTMTIWQLHDVLAWVGPDIRRYRLCLPIERQPFGDAHPIAVGNCDCADRSEVFMGRYVFASTCDGRAFTHVHIP